MEVLTPRDVPLGGLRAMTVRRTLPQRQRSLIGAWCFLDHYGPDEVARSGGGMVVPPHPHTGLQTVSWLFTGEIEHRDSAGHHATVRPGELNLLTAARGIIHSEYSTPETTTLHGAQLWLALPDGDRQVDPTFEHHAPEPISGDGWEARVFIGSLLGSTSPVKTYSPLLGAELTLEDGATLTVPVDPSYELGVLVDQGDVRVDGKPLARSELGFVEPGADSLEIAATGATRLLLIGGPPFGEQIVMWWNYIGREHEEVVAYRAEWEALLETGASDRFSLPDGDPLEALHSPPLPNARMVKRGP
jgi:redox-sensitive bicupin YhaK (pirin superfamily)